MTLYYYHYCCDCHCSFLTNSKDRAECWACNSKNTVLCMEDWEMLSGGTLNSLV